MGGLRRPTGVLAALRPELAATGPPARRLASGKGMGEGPRTLFRGISSDSPALRGLELGVSQTPAVSFLLGEVCSALFGEVPYLS